MAIGMNENNLDKETVETLQTDNNLSERNKNSTIMIVIIAVILLVTIFMVKSIMTKSNTPNSDVINNEEVDENSEEYEDYENYTESIDEETEESNSMQIGLPEFTDEEGVTSAYVYSANDYIKDLNGSDIPAVYEVATRTYVRDFVNYEAKRAILDDGMEMYWLEITYKNKPYRCQVPFYIFKDLEVTGICVVEIELLTLDGGEQIISYMQVIDDYAGLINE